MEDSLLMVDLDGTLIRGKQSVLPEAIAVLLSPIAAERRLVINSARHPRGVQNALSGALPFVPTIALNGAALCEENWAMPSQIRVFDQTVVDDVIDISTRHDLALSIYTAEGWWVTRLDATVEHEAMVTGMTPEVLTVMHPSNVLKMTAMGHKKSLDTFELALSPASINCTRSNMCYSEISPADTNKASFIPVLLKYLGFARNQVKIHYLGDSHNDIECAAYSDYAYTFNAAPAALRRIARRVFPVETDYELVLALREILQECQ
ncbi:MAG: HAD-IIB family hydrolase [bacterium]|nr:HAD-IIB family hydrolase [bacterium]